MRRLLACPYKQYYMVATDVAKLAMKKNITLEAGLAMKRTQYWRLAKKMNIKLEAG